MKVLFIGTLYPKEREAEIKAEFGFFDIAGNVMQWSLLSGFDAHCQVDVISIPTLGKRVKKIVSSSFCHKPGSTDFCSGFINAPILKEITASVNAYKVIKARRYDLLFVYSIGPSSLLLASLYKEKFPEVKVVQMVTDLPEFMSSTTNLLYRILKKIESNIDYSLMKCVDGFLLLAPAMSEKLPIGLKPWIQVEGVFDNKSEFEFIEKSQEKVVLYTGNLDARYGLLDLLDAFSITKDESFRLWICGNGDMVPEIIRRQAVDKRIVYFGCISRTEVLRMQKMATLLVNPRHSTELYTRFSFPSKTMEYMASGTPTLMSKLHSLPEDYLSHLFIFEDESVMGISEKIKNILNKSTTELNLFGGLASKFIMENKNPYVQVEKIIEFVKKL